MQQSAITRRQLTCPKLPLAVYREVAAHLRQVEGIETGLISQRSQQFDYYQSQVSALWIEYAVNLDPLSHQRVEEILDYYAQRFGPWQRR